MLSIKLSWLTPSQLMRFLSICALVRDARSVSCDFRFYSHACFNLLFPCVTIYCFCSLGSNELTSHPACACLVSLAALFARTCRSRFFLKQSLPPLRLPPALQYGCVLKPRFQGRPRLPYAISTGACSTAGRAAQLRHCKHRRLCIRILRRVRPQLLHRQAA